MDAMGELLVAATRTEKLHFISSSTFPDSFTLSPCYVTEYVAQRSLGEQRVSGQGRAGNLNGMHLPLESVVTMNCRLVICAALYCALQVLHIHYQ